MYLIKDIIDITFIKKNSLSTSDYFQIEILDNENLLKFIDARFYDSIKNPKTRNIDDALLMDFLDNLFRIISPWEEKYIQNNILDGTEWQLSIRFKDGHNRLYYGKDKYPNNFDSLEEIKNQMIENATGENV